MCVCVCARARARARNRVWVWVEREMVDLAFILKKQRATVLKLLLVMALI